MLRCYAELGIEHRPQVCKSMYSNLLNQLSSPCFYFIFNRGQPQQWLGATKTTSGDAGVLCGARDEFQDLMLTRPVLCLLNYLSNSELVSYKHFL